MILLTMKENTFTIFVPKGDILFQGGPEQFSVKFPLLSHLHDYVITDRDRNDMLAVLARAGLGVADCLREQPLLSLRKLWKMFRAEEYPDDDINNVWAGLKPNLIPAVKEFEDVALSAFQSPTAFFTEALCEMGWNPKGRIDEDWWLNSGLWKVKGPMGWYYQNTAEGMTSFEPFQIKGGFKMNKTKNLKDKIVLIFDLRNAGPSIIVSYNISPETKILEDQGYKPPLNGIWWRKNVSGYLPRICEKLISLSCVEETYVFAKKMLQVAVGVFGHKECALYDVDIARSVTRALRNVVRRLGTVVPKALPKTWKCEWVYSDNDSVGFALNKDFEYQFEFGRIVKNELRKINPDLEIKLEKFYKC